MALTYKVTFVVPQAFQQDLREQVIKDGYGMRGKSKWISEAIESLLEIPNYIELVHYNDEMKGFAKMETIVVAKELKNLLDQAIIAVRKQYPTIEGVQSHIVRTAILQRLLRS